MRWPVLLSRISLVALLRLNPLIHEDKSKLMSYRDMSRCIFTLQGAFWRIGFIPALHSYSTVNVLT